MNYDYANPAMPEGLMNLFLLCCLGIINLPLFLFWLWLLIDLIKRDFEKDNDKLMWLLIILLSPIYAGAFVYYFLIKKKDIKSEESETSKVEANEVVEEVKEEKNILKKLKKKHKNKKY